MIISIDIGGTNIKHGLVNVAGELIEKGWIKTPKTNYEAFMSHLEDIIKSYQKTHPNILGIALSIPAPCDVTTGIIKGEGSLPFLMNNSLKADLSNRLNMKVTAENDGNCAALAEVWKGAAKDVLDMVLVVCGTGVGGAVVKGRRIHHGKHLYAGEFGFGLHHFDLDTKEVKVWSDYAATQALVKSVAKRKQIPYQELDGEQVFKFAEQQDPIAIEEIDRFYYSLAVGIHNIQYYYDPELILMGGAISNRTDFIEQIDLRLVNLYEKMEIETIYPNVKVCSFKNDANLIGAAYHFITFDEPVNTNLT